MATSGWRSRVFVVGVLVVAGLLAPAPVGAQGEPGAGLVFTATDLDGNPVAGVAADVWERAFDGDFLTKLVTGDDGTARIDVEPGCYAIRVLAPDDTVVEGSGSRYWDQGRCPGPGQTSTVAAEIVPAVIDGNLLIIDDGLRNPGPYTVDFFEARADGSRGAWLGETFSAVPFFRRAVAAGCYVVVFISPSAVYVFPETGGPYLERPVCVEPGQRASVEARLVDPNDVGTLGGTVERADGSPVAGVVADYYATRFDGSRAGWLGGLTTDGGGAYRRIIDSGCYWVVLVAPDTMVFASTGTEYRELASCVDPGNDVVLDRAVLVPT